MTAPDVAALAAADFEVDEARRENERWADLQNGPHRDWWLEHAEKVIAALAAQGWRITSAPEPSSTLKTLVSAQAAPDPKRLLQGQFSYAMDPGAYLPGDFTTTYDEVIDRALQTAVRAALEGLRAEVAAYPIGISVPPQRVLAIIDARLAALR